MPEDEHSPEDPPQSSREKMYKGLQDLAVEIDQIATDELSGDQAKWFAGSMGAVAAGYALVAYGMSNEEVADATNILGQVIPGLSDMASNIGMETGEMVGMVGINNAIVATGFAVKGAEVAHKKKSIPVSTHVLPAVADLCRKTSELLRDGE